MFSLKTSNLGLCLLSLAGYGTYVNVLTLHNLLYVQKFSIFRTVTTYKKVKHDIVHDIVYIMQFKLFDLSFKVHVTSTSNRYFTVLCRIFEL